MEKEFIISLSITNKLSEQLEICLFELEPVLKNTLNSNIDIPYLPSITYNELVKSCQFNKYIIRGLQTNISNFREINIEFYLSENDIYLFDSRFCELGLNNYIYRSKSLLRSFQMIIDAKTKLYTSILPDETIVLQFHVSSYLEGNKRIFCRNMFNDIR